MQMIVNFELCIVLCVATLRLPDTVADRDHLKNQVEPLLRKVC